MIPSGTPASRSAEPSAAGCHGVRDRNIPAIRGPELVVAAEAISERAPRSSVRCSRRKNSLQDAREFPAIFHRELCCNPLILGAEMASLTRQFPRNRTNSLLFSLLAENQAVRPVRMRLPPPPRVRARPETSRNSGQFSGVPPVHTHENGPRHMLMRVRRCREFR